jgi:hypothetical protein
LERKSRILSVACYFGLAPFLWFSGVTRQQNRLLNHHLLYSLVFSFTVFCSLVFYCVATGIQYWIIVHLWNPTMAEYESQTLLSEAFNLVCVFASLLIVFLWGFAWVRSVQGAWRGQTPHISIIAWVASKIQAVRFAVYWSLLIESAFLFLISIGINSVRITQAMPEKADVYILYTVGGYIPAPGLYETFTPPRWSVTMAFYPLIQAGIEKFGDQGVSVLPLSEDSFNEAIHNGRFIFVASHGGISSGAFTISSLPYKEYKPSDVAQSLVGEQLQYAYFAGCWTGDLESEWRQVLGLDESMMFDRLSFVTEHMLWVWFKSPGVISGLK